MNFIQEAKLTLTSEKTCFMSLPRKFQSLNISSDDVFVIESLENGRKLFVSWSGKYTSDESVEINGLFAGQHQLNHGEFVIINQLDRGTYGNCEKIYVEPIFNDDWEILYTHHVFIESQLLRQIRIVTPGLIFPIFISSEGNLQVFVKVSAVSPANYLCSTLHEMTELHLTSVEDNSDIASIAQQKKLTLFGGILNTVSHLFNKPSNQDEHLILDEKITVHHLKKLVQFKLFEVIQNKDGFGEPCWNTIFVHPSYFDKIGGDTIKIVKLKVILSPDNKSIKTMTASDSSKNIKQESSFDENTFIETFVKVESTVLCSTSEVISCNSLQRQLGLRSGSRISLQNVPDPRIFMTESDITLIPLEKSTTETILYKVIAVLNNIGPLILCHGTLITIEGVDYLVSSDNVSFIITPKSLKNINVGQPSLEPVKTSWGSSLPLKRIDHTASKWVQKQPFQKPPGYHDLFEKLICLLESSWSETIRSSVQSILLYGPRGSGKSSVIQSLINHVVASDYKPYVHVLDVKSLRGKRPETISRIMFKEYSKLAFHQPSLLILEDIDTLLPKSAQEESGPEQLQNYRIALIFISFWSSFIRHKVDSKIVIISTAKSIEALNDLIIKPEGNYFFTQFIEVKTPGHEEREEILNSLIDNIGLQWDVNDNSFQDIVKTHTNGYLPGDLKSLVDQVVHEAAKQHCESSRTVELFESVLKNFTPSSLRGVNFKVQSSRKLADVGGLFEVKKILLETLLWPSKYPVLYSKIPVQTNNNILLHGPSGTGKTLLAEAIANEIGINFLKVEGPELLSKYIGASELAVRDVFKKAASIRPVMLFFDEFDSIAPRRGHDSTGVTDRVVNQLLTQLDGIEDIETGVFVLAATSRIDLIDPALLRPGRFNKCLLCPIPNESERLEILQVLSRTLLLDREVDLKMISKKIHGYTGADIQAILCTSQLAAFHETFDSKILQKENHVKENLEMDYHPTPKDERIDPPSNIIADVKSILNNVSDEAEKVIDDKPVEIEITMAHLEEAIRTTKASTKSETGDEDKNQRQEKRSKKRVTLK